MVRNSVDAVHRMSTLVVRHRGIWVGLTMVVVLCWLLLVRMDADMSTMGTAAVVGEGTRTAGDGLADLAMAIVMWAIMMVAMMLPTLPPSVLMHSTLAMRRDPAHSERVTSSYIVGYAASWIGFAVPAAALQWALSNAMLLDPMARSTSSGLNAGILLAAGVYQLSPLKRACLSKCRTPLGFFIAHWRDGIGGALRLGLHHGGYCIACCWSLMAAMFVVGAMNLFWMGLFTLVVLGEKIFPRHWRFDQAVGAVLIASGLWFAASFL